MVLHLSYVIIFQEERAQVDVSSDMEMWVLLAVHEETMSR